VATGADGISPEDASAKVSPRYGNPLVRGRVGKVAMTGNSDKHSYGTLKALRDAIIACTASADRMFGELAGIGADNPGITRDAYGEGENAAHKWFAEQANALGLETTADFAL